MLKAQRDVLEVGTLGVVEQEQAGGPTVIVGDFGETIVIDWGLAKDLTVTEEAATGGVFDLRDYPNTNHKVLSHLLTRPDDSNAWLAVPHVIRPDHISTAIPTWETSGLALQVLQPHVGGRVAFLTGPGVASYSESVMGMVEHYPRLRARCQIELTLGVVPARLRARARQLTGSATVCSGSTTSRCAPLRSGVVGAEWPAMLRLPLG